jgi:hypothetical protein
MKTQTREEMMEDELSLHIYQTQMLSTRPCFAGLHHQGVSRGCLVQRLLHSNRFEI